MKNKLVIGLEVHVELATEAKAYCACKNEFGAGVNTNCCEICCALPGALPSLNKKVVEHALRMGLALNCSINKLSRQDRKNYFYPDLAKAYQITQDKTPICGAGHIDIIAEGEKKRIGINRIHMEEDTAKLLHDDSFSGTLIDFNRSGVPLIEIVTEPDFSSATEVKTFLETLKRILVHLGVSDGKMQEGSIRCDVNVSTRNEDGSLGTRVEMKNVNTFSGAERAVTYESGRQISAIGRGETIIQETRRWIDDQGINEVLRIKADANDYRYFPEPDLGIIHVSDEMIKNISDSMPELPNIKHERYVNEYGIIKSDADLMIDQKDKTDFFEAAIASGNASPKLMSNWILGDVTRVIKEEKKNIAEANISPLALSDMVARIESGEISSASGKIIIEEIIKNGGSIEEIIKEKSLAQISDLSSLEAIVELVIKENPAQIADYHAGKTNILGFLVGQCMKKSAGKGNPGLMKELLLKVIDKNGF